jgi:hypothetical protein
MQTPTAILPTSGRSSDRLVAVGAFGCLLAVAVGAAAATGYGVPVAGAMIALVFFGTAIVVYVRDPIIAFVGLWLFEVFNPSISAVFGYFSSAGEAVRQANELLVALFVCLTIWRTLRGSTRMPPLRFVVPGVGVAVFGIIGAVVHDVPFTVAAVGGWLGLKLWSMVVITLLLPWKPGDLTRVYTIFVRVGLFVGFLGLLDYLTHAAISNALHTSTYRFEAEAFRGEAVHSIFPQPGEYSLFMSMLFALVFTRFATKRSRTDLILALMFAGSVVLSLRLKGFLSLAAVVAIVALAQGFAGRRGGVTVLLISALLFIGAYSFEGNVVAQQVSTYTTKTSPREHLYKVGEEIASDDFPLGVGFGRFASYPSRIYYSPVYDQYELSGVYGLSRAYPDFIDDTSWPSVMGETGWAGLIFYAAGVIVLLLAIIQKLRVAPDNMKWGPLAALCLMAVLLVTSTGQGVLFDWLAITSFVVVLGPALIETGDPLLSDNRLVPPS